MSRDIQPNMPDATRRVLLQAATERRQQDAKWGQQRHPDLPPYLLHQRQMWATSAREKADMARAMCQGDSPDSDNWLHILEEEYREMLAEAWEGNTEALRTELIQVIAVCVNWVETIDARAEAEV